MSLVIRNASFYMFGKKGGKINQGTVSLSSGNEIQVGDGEVLGASEGVTQGTIDVTSVEPVSGAADLMVDAFINKKDVPFGVGLLDGKILKCTIKIFDCNWDTDMARGTLVRKLQMHLVSKPEFVG